MAYKFQLGPAQLSGALTQEGAIVGESTISASSDLLAGGNADIAGT